MVDGVIAIYQELSLHLYAGFFISLFGDAMSQNNIDNEILATEQEIKHLGSCTTKGLTDEEKKVFKKELIEFMEERKKVFNGGE